MKVLKRLLTIPIGLAALSAVAATAPDRPLHILYLGPVPTGNAGPGGGGSRTNYVYLPGQTLAPEAIYFDPLPDTSQLTESYLHHFDAVAQAVPDAALGSEVQKRLAAFQAGGNPVIRLPEGQIPTGTQLRDVVLAAVPSKARTEWEASNAARPTLQRLSGAKLAARLHADGAIPRQPVRADFGFRAALHHHVGGFQHLVALQRARQHGGFHRLDRGAGEAQLDRGKPGFVGDLEGDVEAAAARVVAHRDRIERAAVGGIEADVAGRAVEGEADISRLAKAVSDPSEKRIITPFCRYQVHVVGACANTLVYASD